MQLSSTEANIERQRRSWLIEVLVVVGVLGFGYFALLTDQAPDPITAQQAMR